MKTMGFLISHKSGEQRRALLPENIDAISHIEMITEEGSELSSSILCRMWAGKHMLMSPNSSKFSTIRSRSGVSIPEQPV